ncbi:MAG: TetR/AcrR family transcriptional regulator [Deltaproteobacteria bacterium]|nr:TetR/AcrR family transcriptional regulator [Deltaproteobacteria bacterium]MCB9479187.1 TetR/AcrR family transcriptional regulator [Deltaproteobacteria bacterium]
MAGTRENILMAAETLMQRQGYAGTSVDQICSEAGITKGAFFHYFPNKEAIGLAALEEFGGRVVGALFSAPYMEEAEPVTRLFGYVDRMIEMCDAPALRDGCLVAMLTLEHASGSVTFREKSAAAFDVWAAKSKELFEAAIESRGMSGRLDPGNLAHLFIAVFEGSLIIRKAKEDSEIPKDNIRQLRKYLEMQLLDS